MRVLLTTILLLQSMPGYFGKSNLRRSVFDAPTFSSDPEFVSGGLDQARRRRFIFDAPTIYGSTCSGSMEIETKDGNILILRESVTRTRISVERIKVHGCGCYSLHSGRYGRGSKQVVFPAQTWGQSDIGFSRIRSIFRIQCWLLIDNYIFSVNKIVFLMSISSSPNYVDISASGQQSSARGLINQFNKPTII